MLRMSELLKSKKVMCKSIYHIQFNHHFIACVRLQGIQKEKDKYIDLKELGELIM